MVLDVHMQKDKSDPYLTSYTNVNSKGTKHLNVRPEIIKLLRENITENLHDVAFSNEFLDVTLKEQVTKANTDM